MAAENLEPASSNGNAALRDALENIDAEMHRIASLRQAINEAIDFRADDPQEQILDCLSRALDYLSLQEDVERKVCQITEEMLTRLQPAAMRPLQTVRN